ncbi:hypothetical protein X798_06901 [Onchocerca flexuosa]|uniref:Uncharacterized protein n=1 Tax=Onchocerca flexuosa TaxID=387005 RepID=A0A238BLM3_9BILA|nr:hypothetical protein X798_06901 [Onchocerca flexuosa]
MARFLRIRCANLFYLTGDNVEDAFLNTARKIYQNIKDGSLDLNQADTGVQPKQILPRSAQSAGQEGKNFRSWSQTINR